MSPRTWYPLWREGRAVCSEQVTVYRKVTRSLRVKRAVLRLLAGKWNYYAASSGIARGLPGAPGQRDELAHRHMPFASIHVRPACAPAAGERERKRCFGTAAWPTERLASATEVSRDTEALQQAGRLCSKTQIRKHIWGSRPGPRCPAGPGRVSGACVIGLGLRGPAECVPCQVLGRQCHVKCSAFPALPSALRSLPPVGRLANRLLPSRAVAFQAHVRAGQVQV